MRLVSCAFSLVLLSAGATSAYSSALSDQQALEQIERTLVDGQKAKDTDHLMTLYLPDESLLVFDVMGPRQWQGAKSFRKDWEDFFKSKVRSIEKVEDLNLVIEHSGTLGASHFVQHFLFTDINGNKGEIYSRLTHTYRKVNGRWYIVHEHASVPIDWATQKGDFLSQGKAPG